MAKLKEFAQLDNQVRYTRDINSFFQEFWSYNPTREEFRDTCTGLLFTPDMLYTMVKGTIL